MQGQTRETLSLLSRISQSSSESYSMVHATLQKIQHLWKFTGGKPNLEKNVSIFQMNSKEKIT